MSGKQEPTVGNYIKQIFAAIPNEGILTYQPELCPITNAKTPEQLIKAINNSQLPQDMKNNFLSIISGHGDMGGGKKGKKKRNKTQKRRRGQKKKQGKKKAKKTSKKKLKCWSKKTKQNKRYTVCTGSRGQRKSRKR
jgi:hypothetical protein